MNINIIEFFDNGEKELRTTFYNAKEVLHKKTHFSVVTENDEIRTFNKMTFIFNHALELSKLAETVEKIGYELVSFEDCLNGFTVVIAKNECNYATWIYNNETNSLFGGNYFIINEKLGYSEFEAKTNASVDYWERAEEERLN